jgi:hypothetical protein
VSILLMYRRWKEDAGNVDRLRLSLPCWKKAWWIQADGGYDSMSDRLVYFHNGKHSTIPLFAPDFSGRHEEKPITSVFHHTFWMIKNPPNLGTSRTKHGALSDAFGTWNSSTELHHNAVRLILTRSRTTEEKTMITIFILTLDNYYAVAWSMDPPKGKSLVR